MPFHDTVLPIAKSRTVGRVFLWSLLVGAYSCLAVYKEMTAYRDLGDVPSQIHAALSVVLGCLLVFRTNSAYNRWWEARTLWGSLVNTSRNLAIKLHQFLPLGVEQQELLRQLIVAFPVALKYHLRDESARLPQEIRELSRHAVHVPQSLADRLYWEVREVYQQGRLESAILWMIDEELRRLMDICGGCERIQRTRIVESYRTFARQITTLILLTLPWGVVADFHGWTIPLTIIVAYFMIGLEIVAEHVEEPFGYDEDDLDLDSLCRTIEATVSETFATVR